MVKIEIVEQKNCSPMYVQSPHFVITLHVLRHPVYFTYGALFRTAILFRRSKVPATQLATVS